MTSTEQQQKQAPPVQPQLAYVHPQIPQQAPAAPRPPAGRKPIANALATAPPVPPSVDHTITTGSALLAAGELAHLAAVSPWWFAASGAAATIGAGIKTHMSLPHAPNVRKGATPLAVAAGAAATAWWSWSAQTGAFSPLTLLGLATGTGIGGLFYGTLRWRYDKTIRQELTYFAQQAAERKRVSWDQILADAGLKDVVVDTSVNEDGWKDGQRQFPAGFALALQLGRQAPTVRGLSASIPDIERVASNATTLPIRPGSIQVKGRTRANEAEIIVPSRDIMAETFDMPRGDGPRSINDPLYVAQAVDGTPIGPTLTKDIHGLFSGQMGGGKSASMNAHAYETTRCIDNVTWMIAGEKPNRAFKYWLKPWLKGAINPANGQPIHPVLDWVAPSWDEAMMMLADAYKAISIRQGLAGIDDEDDKWIATPESPHITIFIDESPGLLRNTKQFKTYDGKWFDFSGLLLEIARLARSEGIHIFILTQRGTVSMLGGDGGDLKSQLPYRVGFRAQNTIDLNAVFDTDSTGIDLTSLVDGGLYMERVGDTRPTMGKGYWCPPSMQEEAAIMHAQYAFGLDEGTANGLDYYAERWTRDAQQKFFASMSKVRAAVDGPGAGGGESFMGQFEAWRDEHRPGATPDDALLQEFMSDLLGTPVTGPDSGDDDLVANLLAGLADPGEPDPEDPDAVAQAELLASMRSDVDTNMQRAVAEEIDELKALFDAPAVEVTDRNVGQQAGRDLVGVGGEPLSEYAIELVGLLQSSDLLYSDRWLPSKAILAAAVEQLEWPATTEGERRIAGVMREIGVLGEDEKPSRPELLGSDGTRKKTTAYQVAVLSKAVKRYTTNH